MTRTRSLCRLLAVVACLVALSVAVLSAQDRSRYRDSSAFRLIVASARLGTLAQVAGAGAVPPGFDRDVQFEEHKQARLANKAAFKP